MSDELRTTFEQQSWVLFAQAALQAILPTHANEPVNQAAYTADRMIEELRKRLL